MKKLIIIVLVIALVAVGGIGVYANTADNGLGIFCGNGIAPQDGTGCQYGKTNNSGNGAAVQKGTCDNREDCVNYNSSSCPNQTDCPNNGIAPQDDTSYQYGKTSDGGNVAGGQKGEHHNGNGCDSKGKKS